MRIVTGTGRRRNVWELPCSQLVKAAPDDVQKAAVAAICGVMERSGVVFSDPGIGHNSIQPSTEQKLAA